ncbi:MAG: peptidoglycan binding domain-containing protein, partial [Candidatus Micrarchaeota archaeon]|nr:peptidoglycan binding domain-containing protein [Candidatus Micrarchaeota archaeon]
MARDEEIKRFVKKYFWHRWWERAFTIGFVSALFALISGTAFAAAYRDQVYPGVSVGAFPLGGLSRAEAERTLSAPLETLKNRGLAFVFRDRTITVPMVATAPGDPDLSYEVIEYNLAQTADRAYAAGRTGSLARRWSERLAALGGGVKLAPDVLWRQDKVAETLKQNLAAFENPAQDARFVFGPAGAAIAPERDGIVFNYRHALSRAELQLESLIFNPIPLELLPDTPAVTRADAERFLPEVSEFARGGPATIRFGDLSWQWPRAVLNGLLEIRSGDSFESESEIGLSLSALKQALEPIIGAITAEPQEPRLT